MSASGALFPSLVAGSRGSSSKYLVEFRAGKMSLKGSTVTPDKRKGQVYIQQTDDSLIHFCWKDRTAGTVEDDLIIFPDDCEFKRVAQCTTGRVYVLKFKAGSKRLFFWMQEPKSDKDEEFCRKVNEYLNNPPMPGALGGGGSSGGHELAALGGSLGALAGPAGLAGLLGSGGPSTGSSSSGSRSQSAAITPSSTTSAVRMTSVPSVAAATTPVPAPTVASTAVPAAAAAAAALTPPAVSSTASAVGSTATSATASASATASGSVTSPTQHIQLRDLQSILASMTVPAAAEGTGQQAVDLASVLTPEIMAPILANAEVQERLLPYLPTGESLPQPAEEIQNTLTSPQFQQAMSMFSAALASGQLGPLMSQFGLPAEAVEAAGKGDVEGFAKAMQHSSTSSSKTKVDEKEGDSDSKDKKDEEEDMSLD
uniref:proteasomal ubiquitin receptor ADRM1 isoform X3 n=1 Tax=Pristiophorus japonicus TaxID=55135 RepID=UPI00398F1630